MKITCLIENKAVGWHKDLKGEHGLSLYIESEDFKLLFDTGQGSSFLENAASIIDLEALGAVDAVILSHGHYDHVGGLAAFFKAYGPKRLYARVGAFDSHVNADGKEIGIPNAVVDEILAFEKVGKGTGTLSAKGPELRLLDKNTEIAKGVWLFSLVEVGQELEGPDRYSHEQHLAMRTPGGVVLVTGCAHQGIEAIIETCTAIMGEEPAYVIGGFHLRAKVGESGAQAKYEALARRLAQHPAQFFTGHCTEGLAYAVLEDTLGDRLKPLNAGTLIEISSTLQRLGRVHVYTGNGKGKTTAAMGLALRALGAQKRVYVGQFVKDMAYSETLVAANLEGFTIEQLGMGCFIQRNPEQADIASAQAALSKVATYLRSGYYSLVVLDEINIALYYKLLTPQEVIAALEARHPNVEVVITGRYAPQELLDYADLVTEMQEIKHYYKEGVISRKGIDC